VNAIKYRKKPVVIEARQLSGGNGACHEVYLWIEEHIGTAQTPGFESDDDPRPIDKGVSIDPADGKLVIRTLEGDMKAEFGDWIIKGVQGEFYPCKPDIFAKTYEIEENQ
jgi:hypothetical protein